jgi:ABC-type multidrug transport system fused ATPase/permease subunit
MSVKKKNIKQSGLLILIVTILCFGTTNAMAISISIDSVSTIIGIVSYWDILLYIACMLIVVPFIYIGYLKIHIVTEEQLPFHFGGEYTAKDIIKHVEGLEKAFGKKFSKFKRLMELLDKNPEGDLRKHSEIINSALLCIKFNGRKRLAVFWESSDTMLKVIILLLPLIVVTIVFISNIYYGLGGVIMSLVPMVFIVPVILTTFSNFLRISQNIFRKKGNPLPALSLANLATDALINTHIVRSFDKESKEHFYYTRIHKYNNEANAEVGFLSKVYVRTSSEIYGSMQELTIGEK